MLTSDMILKEIEKNREMLRKYGVKRIGVFGSYSKNMQKAKSDIDILVEFKKGKKTFDNYMNVKFFLEKLFDNKVDLVVKEAIKLDLKRYILSSVKYATGV